MAVVEPFIRNADNQVRVTLTEDAIAIVGAWTGLEIHFGGVTLTRAVDGDGVTLSAVTGLLTINPGDLTAPEKAAIDLLEANHVYSVKIVLTSATNDDGAVWGNFGSTRIYFQISDKPA